MSLRRPRVIPTLLLHRGHLVKTVGFADPIYVGDPLNAIRIFNDKGADELAVIDIDATPAGRPPDFARIAQLASECFMPLAYGGGVTRVEEIHRLVGLGVEKVIVNSGAASRPTLLREAAGLVGSQSVVAAIDFRRGWTGRAKVVHQRARSHLPGTLTERARAVEKAGAGEIFLNAVDRDGTRQGYDLPAITEVAQAVSIPVIACGGARHLGDLAAAYAAGADAVAAGSMFVFRGEYRAVLISLPREEELGRAFAAAPRGKPA